MMQKQMELQREQMDQQLKLQKEQMQIEQKQHQEELQALRVALEQKNDVVSLPVSPPAFTPFDSSTELWNNYWSRFCTFVSANSIPEDRKAQVFLTNQSPALYKQLANLASQQSPPKEIKDLGNERDCGSYEGAIRPKTIHCEREIQVLE